MGNLIQIQNLIYEIRGLKVMLDSVLAKLYGVATRVLNQAVKRNIERFPDNFMFQMTQGEFLLLISQNVISKNGVVMHSSVLNRKRAIQINIQIMNTFVKVRQIYQAIDLLMDITKPAKIGFMPNETK